jgi:peptidoglycan biosynthesis protein MviN/MurJ (putative lipid II flippase)
VHGLSFTLSVSNAVQAALLMILVRKKVGALGISDVVKAGLGKLALALVAVGAAWAVSSFGEWPKGFSVINVVVLGASIGAAVVIYGGGALMLRLRGADDIGDKLRRKLLRR